MKLILPFWEKIAVSELFFSSEQGELNFTNIPGFYLNSHEHLIPSLGSSNSKRRTKLEIMGVGNEEMLTKVLRDRA